MMARKIKKDLKGMVFGKLTAICISEKRIGKYGQIGYMCRCECGKTLAVRSVELTRGSTRSCGCQRLLSVTKHGFSPRGPKALTYKTWLNMKARCCNRRQDEYKNYGGRGITICSEWLNDYPRFLSDMGERPSLKHSLDRIDPNGNYSKANCRWSDIETQNNNRRGNVKVQFIDTTLSVTQWARLLPITATTITRRLSLGWTEGDALFTAPRSKLKWSGEKAYG